MSLLGYKELKVQKGTTYILILKLCLALSGCPTSSTDSNQEDGEKMWPGDYYSFIYVEGDYKVLKVLVVEK